MESVPKARLTQAERRSRTRRRLLDAGMELFAKRGFDGTSVEQIARKAGYSTGALYANFDGKDDLFFAIFDEHLDWVRGGLAEIDLDRPDEAVAVDVLALLEEHPQQMLVFFEFWAYAVRDPKTRRRLAGRLAEIRELIEAVLRGRAEARGVDLPLPAADLVLVLVALGRGIALEAMADPSIQARDIYGTVVRRLLDPRTPVRA